MLFVLWPIPMLFVVLYVVGFERWIWSPADREEFDRIVAGNREDAD
jgi:hypothetical protein